MKKLARQIFENCVALSEELGRPISPDGHMVGGLGEVYARDEFSLKLADPSNKGYDATLACDSTTRVEIKATMHTSAALLR